MSFQFISFFVSFKLLVDVYIVFPRVFNTQSIAITIFYANYIFACQSPLYLTMPSPLSLSLSALTQICGRPYMKHGIHLLHNQKNYAKKVVEVRVEQLRSVWLS